MLLVILTLTKQTLSMTEDLEEARISSEETILRDIEDTGCLKVVQDEVSVRVRVSACSHVVQVQSRSYIEQNLPFARARLPSANRAGDNVTIG